MRKIWALQQMYVMAIPPKVWKKKEGWNIGLGSFQKEIPCFMQIHNSFI